MNFNGGDAGDGQPLVDREPPSFPRVDDSQATDPNRAPSAPLFAPAGPPGSGAQMSDVVSRPIAAEPTTGRGNGGRIRWLVAGLATLLVVAVVGGVLLLAAPHAGTPSATAHYVPADPAMYAELRLDLPGDQHDNLAAFMSHFPGFADQAAFQQKLDESLKSLVTRESSGAIDWNNDVKPWFGGQIAVFGDPNSGQRDISIASGSFASAPPPQIVIALTVSDKAKLQSTIDAHAGGSQVASVDYQGQQIKTIAQPAGRSTSASYVITDDAVLVAPSVDLLKVALDVKAGKKPGLADQQFFLQQLAALHADRLATFYYDAGKQLADMPALTGSGADAMPAACTQLYSSMGSVQYVGEVRAENDHLAFSVRSQIPSGDNAPPAPTNGQTTLAQSMPTDTLVYLETRNLGATLGWGIKGYLSCMSAMTSPAGGALPSAASGATDPSKLFEQFLDVKPEDFLDFVDDAALGISYSNNEIDAGIVATVDDEATATARMNKLLAVVKLAGSGLLGSSSGMNISTNESDHNGTKVTTITLATGSSDVVTPPLKLQIAVANGRLYLGYDNFVVEALDRQSADSLSSNSKYMKAISAGPSDNAGIVYVDIAAAATALESQMSADDKQKFEADSKPFIDPLSSLSAVSHVDGNVLVSNGFLYVE